MCLWILSPAQAVSAVTLDGSATATVTQRYGHLQINVQGPDTTVAANTGLTATGHFYAETRTDRDAGVGLALIAQKNGKPDRNNFTALFVDTENGLVSVQVADRQNGHDNVLDNTKQLAGRLGRYHYALQGQYSVPYRGTAHRLRIFRDTNSGFFHFYFAVSKPIAGKISQGWMELAPSHDWMPSGTRWYVCPAVRTEGQSTQTAVFSALRAASKPTRDRDDRTTGFRAVRREYNFSGFFGQATVVTFGNHLPLPDKNLKFVFWDQGNNEPWWQISNHAAFSYEHVETWDNSSHHLPGCFEPMSDRNRRWSSVQILEDNPVRKRIIWHYVLTNPDYQVPGDGRGKELPEVNECYTFYPDGTGTRWITFRPNLDSGWDNWHELGEYMTINDSTSWPIDSLSDPCTSVSNRDHRESFDFKLSDFDAFNEDQSLYGKQYEPLIESWPQMVVVQHFKTGVDAFSVWDNAPENRITHSAYKASTAITWHNPHWAMCHWPVGREPYETVNYTHSTWPAQVSEASTIGIEMWNDGSAAGHWNRDYKLDAQGRKYREWVSLIGLTAAGNNESVRDATGTWLDHPVVKPLNDSCAFLGPDFREKTLVFHLVSQGRCSFQISPSNSDPTLQNPVFRFQNWGTHTALVTVNGHALIPGKNCEMTRVGKDLLLWCGLRFSQKTTLTLSNRVSAGGAIAFEEPTRLLRHK